MEAAFTILTPTASPGAISAIEIHAPTAAHLDHALLRLGLAPIAPGACALRNLLDIDRGIVARWSPTCCHLMPHGGLGITRKLIERLTAAGLHAASSPIFPEAAGDIEARMLEALAHAASPMAIDLLLDQPRRWATGRPNDAQLDRVLNRLITPPLVAALGPPNVGKSTLVNTLAGRSIAIVADQPGTTRDHIGVTLDLGGLVVRYLDTPGLRATDDPIEGQAQDLTLEVAARADLILLVGDAAAPPPPLPSSIAHVLLLHVALRSDLAMAPWPSDNAVSCRTGSGIVELTAAIRNALIPPAALSDPRPWRFWTGPETTR